jgi:phenylpropionate dioxygenase-like ring-hydroxylating dioxygenase large terminal subunit
VFSRSWLGVGRADQVANPGDYFTHEILGEPIILTKDKAGTIRAMSNVCPHRWMRVAGHDPRANIQFRSDPCGTTQAFQCPYHLWTFDLQGQLIGAPGMEEAQNFDRSAWGLAEIRVEVWAGFIFVNFDPEAPPLGPQLHGLAAVAEAYELDQLRAMGEPLEYVCDWNWKISVEAGSESYHHLGLHRDTLEGPLPAALSDIEAPTGPYTLYRNLPADPGEAPTAFPPPAGLSTRDRSCLTLVTIFPFTMFFLLPTYTAYLQLIPETHDRHRLRYITLVHPNVDQLTDHTEFLAGVQSTLDAIHQQDMVGGRYCWEGAQSRFAQPGRRSHLETQLWYFQNWLLDQIGGTDDRPAP